MLQLNRNGNRAATMKACVALLGFIFMSNAQQLAFPGAEGYGKHTIGGRGGDVYEVTTLNASGSGSLGEAIGASGKRTVVFKVAGTIDGNFSINNDFITIAGQTAPGDGITIKGVLGTNADNLIIRYIRVRAEASGDALGGRYHKNIILDHVSTSWSADEVLSIYHGSYVTIQWCMITEACEKGTTDSHRFGGIWGNNYCTMHHNLLAHNDSRNPRWASGCGYNDYRNNVLYNWGYESCYGGEAHQSGDRRNPPITHSTINMVANYYNAGPATDNGVKNRIANPSARASDDKGSWYVADNYVNGYPDVTADNWKGVAGSNYIKLSKPWEAMAINQQSAQDAYLSVIDKAGCSLPKRDAIDARIIEEARTGTAAKGNNGIIDRPSDAGGWPELKSTTAPADADHDGMPDDWEKKHNLNPNSADDRNNVGGDGYTMLEEYLNSLIDGQATDIRGAAADMSPSTREGLFQICPTSINKTVNFHYQIGCHGLVTLKLYTVTGQKAATVINAVKETGNYTGAFDGSRLSTGMYSARLTLTPYDGSKPVAQLRKVCIFK